MQVGDTYKTKAGTWEITHRSNDVCIAKGNKGFEVFLVQKNKAGFRLGRFFHASESVPRDNAWGVKGWTCISEESAIRRYTALGGVLQNRIQNHPRPS